ncbi:MFS transporter [Ureibacillus sp. 179-F W5.1 NHS]|uniref:MFS transporter n=1 Tax=Lysinibacillus halotolerans TaxID=1368476 RepID=A0A3M8H5D3_9BACI|nr:MFS transporter [Lysinibacillus halotolerans]RNC97489.1 MFS transporter [Lysinibacillus halotolerans]
MNLKKMESWKYPSILLFSIGVSNIGDWIYFLSLNLIVLNMTDSPLAVSILYIIKPFATLCTNFWAGSMIDRLNKRKLMVFLDVFRALLIALLPFFSSITLLYMFVFLLNMASSIFGPTSMTYITKLISPEKRKQFNSLHSLVTSGAFLIGPAIAGFLFLVGTPTLAIYINAIALFLSGIITLFMPHLEKDSINTSTDNMITLETMKKDWSVVIDFSRQFRYIMTIYILFSSVMMIMASAVDSLEAAFAKEVLLLSDGQYGFLVSIAGAGIMIGAMVNALIVKKVQLSVLIGMGPLLVSIGYVIYAFSNSFSVAAVGFFFLAFFNAFANTGFLTFYQTNIPVEIMGRIGSIYNLIQALMIILMTSVMGVMAQVLSIQFVVIIGVFIMLVVSIILCLFSLHPSKREVRVKE